MFASSIGTAAPKTFTHSKAPNPHARKTSTQNFCTQHPEHCLHTARRQTHMARRHLRKLEWQTTQNFRTSYWHSRPTCLKDIKCEIFASPVDTATLNTHYTQLYFVGPETGLFQTIRTKTNQISQLRRKPLTRTRRSRSLRS